MEPSYDETLAAFCDKVKRSQELVKKLLIRNGLAFKEEEEERKEPRTKRSLYRSSELYGSLPCYQLGPVKRKISLRMRRRAEIQISTAIDPPHLLVTPRYFGAFEDKKTPKLPAGWQPASPYMQATYYPHRLYKYEGGIREGSEIPYPAMLPRTNFGKMHCSTPNNDSFFNESFTDYIVAKESCKDDPAKFVVRRDLNDQYNLPRQAQPKETMSKADWVKMIKERAEFLYSYENQAYYTSARRTENNLKMAVDAINKFDGHMRRLNHRLGLKPESERQRAERIRKRRAAPVRGILKNKVEDEIIIKETSISKGKQPENSSFLSQSVETICNIFTSFFKTAEQDGGNKVQENTSQNKLIGCSEYFGPNRIPPEIEICSDAYYEYKYSRAGHRQLRAQLEHDKGEGTSTQNMPLKKRQVRFIESDKGEGTSAQTTPQGKRKVRFMIEDGQGENADAAEHERSRKRAKKTVTWDEAATFISKKTCAVTQQHVDRTERSNPRFAARFARKQARLEQIRRYELAMANIGVNAGRDLDSAAAAAVAVSVETKAKKQVTWNKHVTVHNLPPVTRMCL